MATLTLALTMQWKELPDREAEMQLPSSIIAVILTAITSVGLPIQPPPFVRQREVETVALSSEVPFPPGERTST